MASYKDHGTSEQFHSEMKSELDLERLPRGKFATNALILELGALAYNVLRLMGQVGLKGFKQRTESKRRRIRTVIQELLCVAARMVRQAGGPIQIWGIPRNTLSHWAWKPPVIRESPSNLSTLHPRPSRHSIWRCLEPPRRFSARIQVILSAAIYACP